MAKIEKLIESLLPDFECGRDYLVLGSTEAPELHFNNVPSALLSLSPLDLTNALQSEKKAKVMAALKAYKQRGNEMPDLKDQVEVIMKVLTKLTVNDADLAVVQAKIDKAKSDNPYPDMEDK